jgi:hypothetical protein
MKREAVHHTKMRRLARHLGVEIWGARGIMESVWHATKEEAPAGDLGKLSNEDIADWVGWTGDADALIEALVRAGWLDPDPRYRLLVHDWSDHAEDSVHAKLARMRMRFANGVTPKLCKLAEQERRGLETANFVLPPPTQRPATAADGSQNGDSAAYGGRDGAGGGLAARLEPNHTVPNLTTPHPTTAAASGQRGIDTHGFADFIGIFLAAGKLLNEKDNAKALQLWLRFEPTEHAIILGHLKQAVSDSTWSDATHTPVPVSYLASEAWRRRGPGRLVRSARTKGDVAQQEAARRFMEGGK